MCAFCYILQLFSSLKFVFVHAHVHYVRHWKLYHIYNIYTHIDYMSSFLLNARVNAFSNVCTCRCIVYHLRIYRCICRCLVCHVPCLYMFKEEEESIFPKELLKTSIYLDNMLKRYPFFTTYSFYIFIYYCTQPMSTAHAYYVCIYIYVSSKQTLWTRVVEDSGIGFGINSTLSVYIYMRFMHMWKNMDNNYLTIRFL